ncbi:hypothetical protein J2X97_001575 [Epilithonimonas hungarica]|uniref:hypothetical protein n=1 Tax=Epilithonimonas hungarica TaxID=454006 RepID=UPI00277D7B2A|nr:hypothetical protein [Epilithonimonas hungarica]MDP9955938.1 hypothetical protein [Epilithonimonas hungarica]
MRKQLQLLIILLIGVAINESTHAQNLSAPGGQTVSTLPDITPPSPTAYALGNYGNVPVGLFTGSPSISIPLFTYKTNNISLPLNLFYGSNGIKVDEVSSNVGLGWNLNFGGVITRMVRDLPDELKPNSYVPDNVTGDITNSISMQFFQTGGRGNIDTEMDIYSFNFNGISGKFFYDRQHQPHLVDQKQAIKIERIGYSNGDGQDFLLTLPTGEKYYFTEKERTTYVTYGAGHSIPQSSITAWYLTKIIHPRGDEVYFTYEANFMDYVNSQSQTMIMSYPRTQVYSCSSTGTQIYNISPTAGVISDNTVHINDKKIKTISSNNSTDGTVVFIYDTNSTYQDVEGNQKVANILQIDRNGNTVENITFNYLNTTNKRNFLNGITFKDSNKTYFFEYENPTGFPVRLIRSQDHWGYYNGKNNTNLVPKDIQDYNLSDENYNGADKNPDQNYSKIGLLKKITYPTKGYTELEYEGNTYWGQKTIYPPIFTKMIRALTDNHTDTNSTEHIIISPINQAIKVTTILSGNSIAACASFNNSGHYAGSIELEGGHFYRKSDMGPINMGNIVSLSNGTPELYFDAVAGSTYKVIVRADFLCSSARANISYYPTAPEVTNTNLDTGGVRIKSTKVYDTSSYLPQYKRYYYGQLNDVNHSSGKIGRKPYYVDFTKTPPTCSIPCSDEGYLQNLILTSSSVINLFDTGTSNCLYEYVTTSYGGDNFENGAEMKQFKIHRDYFGNSLMGNNQSAPWTNFGWDNGNEVKSTVYARNINSQTLDILKEIIPQYENNTIYTKEIKNYNFRNQYDVSCGNNVVKVCTAQDVTKTYTYTFCNAEHSHVWYTWDNFEKCHASGAQNITQTIPDACYGKPVGSTVTYPDNLRGLDVVEYKNISYWHYLKSQTTTDYLNGSPLLATTEYFYNNPSHYQLTNQKTTFPDGSFETTDYNYAHEKNKTQLIEANMIGVPLETTVAKKQNASDPGKVISKTYTDYPDTLPDVQTGNLLLPKSVSALDLVTGNMSTEVSYNQYDNKGNIQQYTTKDGIPTAIVWGYNQTQPIAKIEGATYAQVSSLATAIINASNDDAGDTAIGNPKEQDLLNALDSFRNNTALSGYQVTTYSYDPLIGVRSLTPPSGVRQVYIYDTSNRLKEVKDVSGNILKEYQYNYKH